MPTPHLDSIADFQNLIQNRVNKILLVASLYDAFILAEDGQLQELITKEFANLNLYTSPILTRRSRAGDVLQEVEQHKDFPYDMVLMTMNVGEMSALELATALRQRGVSVPITLLTYDNRHLSDIMDHEDCRHIDRVFIWQGDFSIMLAIIKLIEDELNAEYDTLEMGVQAVLLVEDNVRFYSSYLPSIYTELVKQSQSLISEGVNIAHKMIRARARPKIMLCTTYDEAWAVFEKYHTHLLGVITDLEFKREGKMDHEAGTRLIRAMRERMPELPILLQSNQPTVKKLANQYGVSGVRKGSSNLLRTVRHFMRDNFGFGDFVFRMPDGSEIARVSGLHSLEKRLAEIPDVSLHYHAERGHFSKWLRARTEFNLAQALQPKQISDWSSLSEVRQYLIQALRDYRQGRSRQMVADFSPEHFDPSNSLAQIGSGSMGGKARGINFVRHLINKAQLREYEEDICITVPPAVVLCTEVFDQFMELNDLQEFAIECEDDEEIRRRFLAGAFPDLFMIDLQRLVELMDYPLAVRSSSLLEDSQYQPFAGIYRTVMLANDHKDVDERLRQLVDAVKLVFASTYSQQAKGYISATPYRIEEEKMAVIVQKVQGEKHGDLFYPTMAGVARSHNFYPADPAKAEDGVCSLALGMGQVVAQGGQVMRFCPVHPRHGAFFMHPREALQYSQKHFFALPLGERAIEPSQLAEEDDELVSADLERAQQDGVLAPVASVYDPANEAIYDGLARRGVPFVSFASVLKHNWFPLAPIIDRMLKLGQNGMSRPVEIEFAVQLWPQAGEAREFSVLQMRPMVLARELAELNLDDVEPEQVLVRSGRVLGAGKIEDLHDLVVVDVEAFERKHTQEVAEQVASLNKSITAEGRNYILIGVGRWGSADPWLGIPVKWDHINGARVIVESGFRDMIVEPSQGSHFFQNLTSLGIGYFTCNPDQEEAETLDWSWIGTQPEHARRSFVRHLRFDQPLVVRMNGQKQQGIILKPGAES